MLTSGSFKGNIVCYNVKTIEKILNVKSAIENISKVKWIPGLEYQLSSIQTPHNGATSL